MTPEQILATADLLTQKIVSRRDDVKKMTDYYRGQEGRLRFASDEFRTYFATRFSGFSDNWCEVVADAPIERISYLGMRLDGDRSADAKLERTWEKWDAKRGLQEAILMMTVAKRSYGLVSPGGRISFHGADSAAITRDHATGRTTAGLLLAQDDKTESAQLFLPGHVIKLKRDKVALNNGDRYVPPDAAGWKFESEQSIPTPFDSVPLVELQNKALLDNDPSSDIAGVTSAQDSINLVWAYALNSLDFLSLPARVVLNGESPKEDIFDEEGNKIGERDAELDSMIRERITWLEGQDVKISEWSAGSVDGFTKIIELAVAHIAAQTRTPAHYLLSTGSNTPATGYDLAEAGLVSKAQERMGYAAPAIKEINRLVAIASGDKKAAKRIESGKVLWRKPQYRSEAQLIDGLAKLRGIGFPMEFIAEEYGLEPVDVQRVMKMIEAEKQDPALAAITKVATEE